MDWNQVASSLIAVGGVLVGSGLTLIGHVLTKKQERKTLLNKLIAEKRVDAYEEILVTVKRAMYGAGEFVDGEWKKFPQLLQFIEDYDRWMIELVAKQNRVSHLVDAKLASLLMDLQNYTHNFERLVLKELRNNDQTIKDQGKLEEIGVIVYYDFVEICHSIIAQASVFYSHGVYQNSYLPSTLAMESAVEDSDLNSCRLIKEYEKIEEILSR